MRPMKLNPNRGSHLPVLMKLFHITSFGPILELGSGIYSTAYLHWACYFTKRRLVTYENNPKYYNYALKYKSDYHEIHCIDDWDSIDISEPWSIAFVDHSPGERRGMEIKRLLHADYVVAHDTENSEAIKYGYHKILNLFKYRYKFNEVRPHTTIFSNRFNVMHLKGKI